MEKTHIRRLPGLGKRAFVVVVLGIHLSFSMASKLYLPGSYHQRTLTIRFDTTRGTTTLSTGFVRRHGIFFRVIPAGLVARGVYWSCPRRLGVISARSRWTLDIVGRRMLC